MCDAVDPGNSSKHHGVDLTQSDWDMKVDKGGDVSNHPLGANKPNFSNNVSDMIRRHCPAIMIISETKLYGIRAQNIIDRLPFDGAIVTNSFGRSGGLWLLWDSDQVEGVVCDAWSSLPTLQQAVESFSEKARIWNRSHFGNLFQRKNRVLARLKGIQESLTASPSTHLINLEKMLRGEFAEVAKLEEEFWAMKSRILWLVEKDRNTSFYHIAALVRRRRNRIVCLKDRMGNWINGDREISEFIREDFSDLFTSGVTVVIDLVRKESNNLNSFDVLVADCKEGLKKISNVRLLHCFRETNKCADNLARRDALLNQVFTVFIHLPSEVGVLIRLDARGTFV
ncbi:hypothetical protein CFP56_015784 [Quercus suber]|uniref:RNase H type-1 domain-containing protein n=1 Tax=Quercus suber TaxID=58331 RepID=A0AAW0KPE8_QUESU